MAAQAPIVINLTGATFLMPEEDGARIQSYSRSTGSKEIDIYNASLGYTDAHVFHDFFADYNWDSIDLGVTDLGAASVGVAITFAGPSTGGGVASGTIYTLSTSVSHQAENLRRRSGTAKQWANA